MSHIRISSLLVGLLVSATVSVSALAKAVDTDFKRCAEAALQERNQTAGSVQVKTGGMSRSELDHDLSVKGTVFRMLVTDTSSGQDLGTVTCEVSKTGDLLAASFDQE